MFRSREVARKMRLGDFKLCSIDPICSDWGHFHAGHALPVSRYCAAVEHSCVRKPSRLLRFPRQAQLGRRCLQHSMRGTCGSAGFLNHDCSVPCLNARRGTEFTAETSGGSRSMCNLLQATGADCCSFCKAAIRQAKGDNSVSTPHKTRLLTFELRRCVRTTWSQRTVVGVRRPASCAGALGASAQKPQRRSLPSLAAHCFGRHPSVAAIVIAIVLVGACCCYCCCRRRYVYMQPSYQQPMLVPVQLHPQAQLNAATRV